MVKAFDGNTKELLKIRGVGGGRRKNSRRRESKGAVPPFPPALFLRMLKVFVLRYKMIELPPGQATLPAAALGNWHF